MTVQAAVIALQELVGDVTGIKGAPSYPPDSLNIFPVAAAYPAQGSLNFGVAGEMKGLHNLVVEVHVRRTNLATDVQAVIGYIDSVPDAVMADPTLSGTVSTFERIDYTFGKLSWGDQETFGIRFTLVNVKIRSDL